jgi:hypothetical protein
MIDMRYKPRFLPQMSAPFDIVLEKLDEEGVGYELMELNPSENDGINVSQGVVFADEIEKVNTNDNNPIWIADDNDGNMIICDGHHRYFKSFFDNKPLKAVHIKLNDKDASRILNKIQDIYEYEQAHNMEEIVNNDVINDENGNDIIYTDRKEFLTALEEDNTDIQEEKPSVNPQSIIAYRKEPIKENSVVGNFFTLNPIDGFNKYQIDFDNLLDTNALGVTYKDSQQPTDILAKIWFPHINFEKLSEQYNMTSENLKNKAITEKAMKMGYDGILYNNKLLQGLK